MNGQIDSINVNKNLHSFENDFFYHLNLGKNRDNLVKMFGDIKVILSVFIAELTKKINNFFSFMI
jgi:hypothetical protein